MCLTPGESILPIQEQQKGCGRSRSPSAAFDSQNQTIIMRFSNFRVASMENTSMS